MQNLCAEIKLRAERKGGQMLGEMGVKAGNPQLSHDVTISPPKLSEMGISRKQSSRWQAIAGIPRKRRQNANLSEDGLWWTG